MKYPNPARMGRTAAAAIGAWALLLGVAVQAQPSVTSLYPDGSVQFQATNFLSINLSSSDPNGIPSSAISITLSANDLNANLVTNYTATTGHGLTVSGPAAAPVVTLPLSLTNALYTVIIQATDATGALLQTNIFDTVIPVYIWECEDWDYTGGPNNLPAQFFDNPQVDAYNGLSGTPLVDANNLSGTGIGNAYVRGTDTGNLGTEVTLDIPRTNFLDASGIDYDIGWATKGNWLNYTRTYPKGQYNVVLRASGFTAGPDSASLSLVTSGVGTANQTLQKLGVFNIPNTENTPPNYDTYQDFVDVTLVDTAGNPIVVTTTGNPETFRLNYDGGSWNGNYLMFVTPDFSKLPKPFVSNVSPDATTTMFCATNTFSFSANSADGISPSGVQVTLNGAPAAGVSFSGPATNLQVSLPLTLNVPYKINIQLTDSAGSSSYSTSFGTYADNNYTWECEDWDYTGGPNSLPAQFFDNPQVDFYTGLAGTDLVDAHNGSGGNANYRPNTGGLGNEPNGDIVRAQYAAAGTNDYDIGWTGSGNWANYTRTYPAGVYSVVLRASGNNGGNNCVQLMEVTSGVGTSTQTATEMGQFNIANTSNWQLYTFNPMSDANGNPVVITNTGSVMTYQLKEISGGWNGNFVMLVPQDTIRPRISGLYPNGQAMFQRTNTLSFSASSSLPIATSNVFVTLDGVLQTNLIISGTPTNLSVLCPGVSLDMPHSASIVVNTPNNDGAVSSFYFDTFSPNNYTFEAEDWDYNSGLFFNNPQLDFYAGQAGTAGVDANNLSTGVTDAYRGSASDAGDLGNEVTGDVLRAQYISGSTNDYDVGWTGAGNWANYTRNYPAGSYHVWARASGNNNPGVTNGVSLSWVTGGLGTATQTTNLIGLFNFPYTGGYQTYSFTPLVDANSNLVTLTATGAQSTLQMYENAGGYNLNFFMLVPVQVVHPTLSVSQSGGNVTISWSPAGGTLLSSPALSGPTAIWTPVGTANPTVINSAFNKVQYFRVQVN
jgi:hypothetical protein